MSQFFWKKSLIVSVIPPVPPVVVGVRTLGDLEFLSIKQFQAKLFYEISATFSATGVQISHIVPNGKTFYISKAKVLIQDVIALQTSVGTTIGQCNVDVNFDGTPIDRIMYDSQSSLLAGGRDIETVTLGGGRHTETGVVGFSMIGDGIKTVELDATIVSGSFKVTLEGYEEDTGSSPQIAGTGGTGGGGGVGDIGFLAVKDFENKLRTNDGPAVTTTGVGASLTSNVGKDMYLAKAMAEVSRTDSSTGTGPVTIELRFNGIVIDTKIVNPLFSAGEGTDMGIVLNFDNAIGKMVSAGQIIDINVLANGGLNTVTSSLEVWEEDTGESPGGTGGGSGGGSLRFGATETIFPSAQRAQGSVVTQEFDLIGALYLVIVQDGRIADLSSRTNQGTPVTWSVQAQTQMIDNNITNGIETNVNSTSEVKHDWGSIAVRDVTVIGNQRTTSNNPANSIRFDMEFSDDDITYGSSQFIASIGGVVKSVDFDVTLASQSFRYTKVVVTQANNTQGTVDEIYDKALSGGATNLTFEVFDTERGDWKPLDLTTPIDEVRPIDTGTQFNVISQIGEGQDNRLIMPTATQSAMNLIRAVLTTTDDGLSDTSVVFLKTNTVV